MRQGDSAFEQICSGGVPKSDKRLEIIVWEIKALLPQSHSDFPDESDIVARRVGIFRGNEVVQELENGHIDLRQQVKNTQVKNNSFTRLVSTSMSFFATSGGNSRRRLRVSFTVSRYF
jgi:hypothetical protein